MGPNQHHISGDHMLHFEVHMNQEIDLPKSPTAIKDQVVKVYQTLVVKGISEDKEGQLFLKCSIVQRLLDPPDVVEKFEYRVNETVSKPEEIVLRRTRPSKLGDDHMLVASTFSCELPLVLRRVESVAFPFEAYEASLFLEMSTTSNNLGKQQIRPDLMVPLDHADLTDLISIKVNKKSGKQIDKLQDYENLDESPSQKLLEKEYSERDINLTSSFSFVRLCPDFLIKSEKKDGKEGSIIYHPHMKLTWHLQKPVLQQAMQTVFPVILMVAMQWLNWVFSWFGDEQDYMSYLTRIFLLVLSLMTLSPSFSSRNLGYSSLYSIAQMLFFFVVGIGISAAPNRFVALGGCVISTISLLIPLRGFFSFSKYSANLHRPSSISISSFAHKKKRGEALDLSKWTSPS